MSLRSLFSRRSLHLTVAATTVVVWACDEDPSDGGDDGSSGADDTAESSDPSASTAGSDSSSPSGGDTDARGVTAEDVLRSLADNAFAPTFAEFAAEAAAFESAAQTYADAIAAGDDAAAALEAFLPAYVSAQAAWQRAELFQVGPAAGSSGIAGEFLRDEVYSWPATNTCRIDQEIVAGDYGDSDFTSARLVNVYGFDAIEYLVFNTSLENTCPPQLPINGEGEWAALGDAEIATRRAAYVAAIADDITTVADSLAATWAEGGEWNGYLKDPSSGPLESVQKAMDEILRAMFYIDKQLKDTKIARPAGIKDCSSDICLDELESGFARLSKELAVANVEGFQRLFWAGLDAEGGVGFDDLLASLGEGALGDEMLADAEGTIAALNGVEGSFHDALVADGAALDASHAAVVELTDDLKGDFPAILMLNIPSEAAGDAD